MTIPAQQPKAIAGEDPRGVLTFVEPLPMVLEDAENATQNADFTRRLTAPRGFERAATAAEKQLLAAIGYVVPEDLTTVVSFPSKACRRRVWPAIENQETS